jgi:Na+-transporting methylmalonyl-CoA/oxaloacetate decarboxylase gamma subunit
MQSRENEWIARFFGAVLALAGPVAAWAQEAAGTSAAPERVNLQTVMEISVGGFAVVMGVLVALASATALMNTMEVRAEARLIEAEAALARAQAAHQTPHQAPHQAPHQDPGAQPAAAAGPAVSGEAPPADTQVVVMAAVAAALQGRTFRVRRIHLAATPSLAWSQTGRMQIHSSHALDIKR